MAGILAAAASYLTIWAAILHIKKVRRLARGKYPRICCRLMVRSPPGGWGFRCGLIPIISSGGVGRGHLKIYFGTERSDHLVRRCLRFPIALVNE